MKKVRKGFTLIELLIVITIVGILSAMMAMTVGSATARAKAQSIVSNIEACKTAAAVFYNDHWQDDAVMVGTTKTAMSSTTAAAFLGNTAAGYEYVPNFSDFSSGGITYTVYSSGVGHDNWAIIVDFEADAECDNIMTQLGKFKGYSAVEEDGSYSFRINLTTGKITTL